MIDPQTLTRIFDLEYFFELSPDLLCVAGFDGYFKKINPAVSATLGYTVEELFSRPINSFVHIDDRDVTSRKRESIRQDNPLLNFENRYITKSGEIIWLTWTSMPIKREQLVFAIAKNITHRKKIEEYRRISNILGQNPDRKSSLKEGSHSNLNQDNSESRINVDDSYQEHSPADQAWLYTFESLIRKYTGKVDLNIGILSSELAMSERQLFRRIKTVMGISPNKFIRIIRLQVAWDAIHSGKYRTVSEISNIAGFETPAYFNRLFKEIYSCNVAELL